MIWHNSTFLWLLVIILLVAVLFYFFDKRVKRKVNSFFDFKLFQNIRKGFWELGYQVRTVLIFIALALFTIGLAGPKIGTEVREVQRRGVNMLIALDLSRSMNAEDVKPSRLQKAKFEISRLIERLRGDRVGLMVFTGEAFIQSPMTMDYSALRMFLDIAETGQMPSNTTNFSSAFQKASEAFNSLEEQEDSNAANVLLFIADGENHGPDYSQDLQRLVDEGVIVFTVGIGTREGGPIPTYEDGTSNMIGYVRDSDGNLVNTQLETGTMQDIARNGGGSYFDINSAGKTIEPFFAKLEELEKGEFSSQEFADYKNQYQILLLSGLVFFITGLLFPVYSRK